jgi:hypothetical protein
VDPAIRQQVRAFLDMQLSDTVKARVVGADGRSQRVVRGSRPVLRAQDRAYELVEEPAPASLAATPPSGNDGAARVVPASTPSREEQATVS